MPMEFPPILEMYDNPDTMKRETYYEGDHIAVYDIDKVLVDLMYVYLTQPQWGMYNKLPRNKLLHTNDVRPQESDAPSGSSDETPSD